MIEIAAGLLIIVATGAFATGFMPMSLAPLALGFGGTLIGICLGLALVGHALVSRARAAGRGDPYWLRTCELMGLMLLVVVAFALALPASTARLGLVTIAGLPLNYYAVVQGIPIALVITMFLFARAQHAIDQDHDEASD
jgi:putative solute:sodium symporter small subunit